MLPCQSDAFSLDPNLHYLNCAYMSPLPKRVEAVGISAVMGKRNPSVLSTKDFFRTADSIRSLFAQLVDAPDASSISLIPSVSYAVAIAANNLKTRPGQNIVVLHEQFPSNVYSWNRLAEDQSLTVRSVSSPQDVSRWSEAILSAIDEQTAMVALPAVHWTDGTFFDLVAIGQKTRSVGAALLIDGTQSVGALPFSVSEIQPDALIVAGYKWMMGPYSCGMAYWSKRFLSGRPIEENWINRRDSENFARLVDYESEYQPGAIRFDVGEKSNFILLPMMEEALKMILEWSPERIQTYTGALLEPWIDPIQRLGFHISSPSLRGNHLFGLRLPEKLDPVEVKNTLDEHNVFVSVRGNAIRVAPHLYNTQADMTAMVDALKRSARS
ncbi:MAG TPA: aminotransferase [Bacteroidetes bacterium]|nr:aminotransferase [Bacteroidota bacterium]